MSTAAEPADYRRRILLVVTGLSPQVVTETIFALTRPRGDARPFVPTEVHLVTTREGRERARLTLLSREPGWFHRLCREYKLEGIAFGEENVHVVRATNGEMLDDIRSPEENEVAADAIIEIVRKLTADDDAALHLSIAGGRKTMGFFGGYALSLYGRPQDRLSHVLVSAPYETHQEFFYPTVRSRIIYTAGPESRPIDTKDAVVTLAEIPFVSLRHGIPPELLRTGARFSETVAAARKTLGPPELVFDVRGKSVQCGGCEVKLPPAELAFYAWLARRKKDRRHLVACPGKNAQPNTDYAREYMNEYMRIDPIGDEGRVAGRLKFGMDKEDFMERKAKLNRRLRSVLGGAGHPYVIGDDGGRPKRYGVRIVGTAIRFDGEDAAG